MDLRHTGILGAPPAAPKNLTATSGDGQVVLRWADPYPDDPSIAGYQYRFRTTQTTTPQRPVGRSPPAAGTWSTWTDVSASRRDTTITGLTNGTLYAFALRAVNGEPGAASTATATPASVPGVPDLVSTESSNRQITLVWSAPASDGGSSLTRYEVRWSSDDGSTWGPEMGDGWKAVHPNPRGSGPFRSNTPSDLTNGRKYLFEVRAVNDLGAGAAVRMDGLSRGHADHRGGERQLRRKRHGRGGHLPGGGLVFFLYVVCGGHRRQFVDHRWISGRVSFKVPPDFEAPGDVGTDNVYDFRVKATPSSSQASEGASGAVDTGVLFHTVAVTVTNVDEPGTVSLSTTEPRVSRQITATLSDPDGGITGASWQWQRRSRAADAWSDISSATSPSYTPVVIVDGGYMLRATVGYSDGHGSGKSAHSGATAAVMGRPGRPGSLTATAGDGQVSLSWTAADSNGSSITRYEHTRIGPLPSRSSRWTSIPASSWSTVSGGASARSQEVRGLTNGAYLRLPGTGGQRGRRRTRLVQVCNAGERPSGPVGSEGGVLCRERHRPGGHLSGHRSGRDGDHLVAGGGGYGGVHAGGRGPALRVPARLRGGGRRRETPQRRRQAGQCVRGDGGGG